MFYRKDLNVSNKKSKNYAKTKVIEGFIDGSKFLLDSTGSYNTYNFCYNNGALETGLGIGTLKMPNGNSDMNYVQNELNYPEGISFKSGLYHTEYNEQANKYNKYFICYGSDNRFYDYVPYTGIRTFYCANSRTFTEQPILMQMKINGKDYLLMSNKSDGLFLYNNGQFEKQVSGINITSMCVHDGRLYATLGGDCRSFRYSTDLDPTNWNSLLDTDGEIIMDDQRGILNKVLSFKGAVYVFREFGITKVTVNKNGEAEVNHMFLSGSRIYADTVCVCGDKIFMMLRDGVYVFNGTTVEKLDLPIAKLWLNTFNSCACAVFFNGKYYLASRLDFNDQRLFKDEMNSLRKGNTCLIEIDVNTYEINVLRGVEAVFMFPFEDGEVQKLVIGRKVNNVVNLWQLEKSGLWGTTPTTKSWQSAYTDFGYPCKLKTLRRIQLYTKNDITLEVESERGKFSYAIKGNEKYVQDIPINRKGKNFALTITATTAEAYISNPKIVFEV